MAFWDGTRWVPDPRETPRRPQSTGLMVVSFVTMLVVFGSMLLPLTAQVAASPDAVLSLSPARGAVGQSVKVTGAGFPGGARVQLTWDGSTVALPAVTASRSGSFGVTIKVPVSADGTHVVGSVTTLRSRSRSKLGATDLATTSFSVVEATGDPAATAEPTLGPPAGGTAPSAEPTRPDPTPVPDPTPADPTAAPTSRPTADPTPDPTPRPTPDPTPRPTPDPTPRPTPDPSVVVRTFGPGLTASQLQSAAKDLSIDVIELTSGTYRLGNSVLFDVDRSSRPLTIRPASGDSVTFTGSGSATEDGQFFFGLNKRTSWITMTGFTFSGYLLAQAGVFEVRQSDHVTLNNMTIKNITRDTSHSDKPYKTYGMYVSWNNSRLNARNWNIYGNGRDWSGIQIDSGTVASSVHLTDMTMSDLDYAFYEDVPTTDLVLDGWSVTDCGEGGIAISFHQSTGVYRNMTGRESGIIMVHSTADMTNGGGNDWR